MTSLILQAQGRPVDPAAVLAALGGGTTSSAPPGSLSHLERSAILASLEHTGWNFGETCALLGISRPTLRRKIAQYELTR